MTPPSQKVSVSKFSILIEDLNFAFSRWRFAFYLAFLRKKISVRFSSLGYLLEPIFLLISSFCIALVWNKLFGRGGGDEFTEFFIYILIGFGCWGLISDAVSFASNCFIKNSHQIINSSDPISLYVLSDQMQTVISFMMKMPVILLFAWLYGELSPLALLSLLYGVLLVVISGFGFTLTVGVLCLKYRDMRTVIDTIMRMAFLLTPIIWQAERLGEHQNWLLINPFYSYLVVLRDPLVFGSLGPNELLISTLLTLALLVVGLSVLALHKRSIRKDVFGV